jgi:hypothetical protein
VGATEVALRITAQHSCNLGNACVAARHDDVRGGHAATCTFAHHDVVVGARGDLRQVRDREDLVMQRDATHGLPHLESDATADSGVDFVEHQRWNAVQSREDRL